MKTRHIRHGRMRGRQLSNGSLQSELSEMTEPFPKERMAKRKFLLDAVDSISKTLRTSGSTSEELGTLAAYAVDALVRTGMFRLKLAEEMCGAEADPVTEMLVLEALAYHDMTSGWCTMVGATAIASLGTFLPPAAPCAREMATGSTAAGVSTAGSAMPNGCSAARSSREPRPRTADARSSCS